MRLKSLQNYVEDFGENREVEVMAYGPDEKEMTSWPIKHVKLEVDEESGEKVITLWLDYPEVKGSVV
jgi:hypothetical protein